MHDPDRDQRIIQAILAGGVKIPPMPRVLMELLALERDEDAGPRQYAALIAHDPALTGAVFRVVASPVFGLRARVDTLEKAISLLGLRATSAVARSEALRGALNDPQQLTAMQTLWQRAHELAALSTYIVKVARPRGISPDLAYLVGIFHDCGLAVLYRRYPDYAAALAHQAWPDLVVLDQRFHTDHGVVGEMVAHNWQLPADVALAVRHHHGGLPADLPEAAWKLIVLLRFAMHARAHLAGEEEPDWPLWQPRVEALLERDEAGLRALEADWLVSD